MIDREMEKLGDERIRRLSMTIAERKMGQTGVTYHLSIWQTARPDTDLDIHVL
ncbi:hypothetical protein QUF76_13385 [Desulfobacterales bacterium HSG16]|nr:hypothetical protein [Desulfobacterales bacterium HSG16]